MKTMKRWTPRYYHTCPCCGANLDPGERCDCEESKGSTKAAKEDAA